MYLLVELEREAESEEVAGAAASAMSALGVVPLRQALLPPLSILAAAALRLGPLAPHLVQSHTHKTHILPRQLQDSLRLTGL